jgi:hypothetical protein
MISFGMLLVWILPTDPKVIPDEVWRQFIWPFGLIPEAKERKIFIFSVLALLPITFISFFACRKIITFFNTRKEILDKVCIWSIYFLTIIFPVMTLYLSWSDFSYAFQGPMKNLWAYFVASSLIIALIVVASIYYNPFWIRNIATSPRRISSWSITLYALLLIALFSYRIKSISLVENSWLAWSGINFEIILYSLAQVVDGKTLVIDLPAQYGLYAELLNPLFSLIGLTVFTFTTVMTLLTIISISLFVWIVCIRCIKTNLLKWLGAPLLIASVSAIWVMLPQSPDFYLAYQPIRILFPSLYIALIYFFLKNRDKYATTVFLSLIMAIGLIWNLDTGIPMVGSFICLQAINLISNNESYRRKVIYTTLGVLTIVLVTLGFFYIYLLVKSGGQQIVWHDLVKYQEIHYVAGFNMLPMPRTLAHPWALVIGIYCFGVIGGIVQKLEGKSSHFWDFIFVISICGIGLFAYYQGRSHFYNLCNALWPAVVILLLMADRTFRLVRAKLLSKKYLIPALLPVTFIAIYSINILLFNIAPVTIDNAIANIKFIKNNYKTGLVENIKFIKKNSPNKNCIVIHSHHQSIYYAESSTSSCINGPGFYETHLIADKKAYFEKLQDLKGIDLYIDQPSADEILKNISGQYSIVENSGHGLLLLRKPN